MSRAPTSLSSRVVSAATKCRGRPAKCGAGERVGCEGQKERERESERQIESGSSVLMIGA